jgi:hypothetical protein
VVVDLVDHDIETLRHLSGPVPGDRVMLLQGNAFRLLGDDLGVRPLDARSRPRSTGDTPSISSTRPATGFASIHAR